MGPKCPSTDRLRWSIAQGSRLRCAWKGLQTLRKPGHGPVTPAQGVQTQAADGVTEKVGVAASGCGFLSGVVNVLESDSGDGAQYPP